MGTNRGGLWDMGTGCSMVNPTEKSNALGRDKTQLVQNAHPSALRKPWEAEGLGHEHSRRLTHKGSPPFFL